MWISNELFCSRIFILISFCFRWFCNSFLICYKAQKTFSDNFVTERRSLRSNPTRHIWSGKRSDTSNFLDVKHFGSSSFMVESVLITLKLFWKFHRKFSYLSHSTVDRCGPIMSVLSYFNFCPRVLLEWVQRLGVRKVKTGDLLVSEVYLRWTGSEKKAFLFSLHTICSTRGTTVRKYR